MGPFGRRVGGPCRDLFDCGAGSFCATGDPGGQCVIRCRSLGACPGASACIGEFAGLCQLRCDADLDCRDGYDCQARADLSGEQVPVCTAADVEP